MLLPNAFSRGVAGAGRHTILACAAVLTASLAAGCDRKPEPPPPVAATPAPAPPAAPPPAPTLTRADLLAAVENAASAYAAGMPTEQDGLAGRRFLIRQAFACPGVATPPAPALGLARAALAKGETLELNLTPADWSEVPLVGATDSWEAVEGIWLSRPWLRADGCPKATFAPPPEGSPSAVSAETLGLAVVFDKDGSRLGRRNGRPYAFTVRGPDGQPAAMPAEGYRLALEGRLASFADGRAVHCQAAGPDQRPVCLAAARLDRVAFEDASGAKLSEWQAPAN